MNFLFYCLCFRSKRRKDYRRKLDKAEAQIESVMDFGRFIHRQRQHTIAILSLLTGRQAHIVTKISRLLINEDSVSAGFSEQAGHSDGEVSDQKGIKFDVDC